MWKRMKVDDEDDNDDGIISSRITEMNEYWLR